MMLEVDSRESDGLLVRLSFDTMNNKCFVDVIDNVTGQSFTLQPDNEHAKDMFDHPHAYIKEGVTIHGFAT